MGKIMAKASDPVIPSTAGAAQTSCVDLYAQLLEITDAKRWSAPPAAGPFTVVVRSIRSAVYILRYFIGSSGGFNDDDGPWQ